MVASLYLELVPCALFRNKHMEKDQEKLATASFPSTIRMCDMLENNVYARMKGSIHSK